MVSALLRKANPSWRAGEEGLVRLASRKRVFVGSGHNFPNYLRRTSRLALLPAHVDAADTQDDFLKPTAAVNALLHLWAAAGPCQLFLASKKQRERKEDF